MAASDTDIERRESFYALARDIAAMISLTTAGTVLALTGHDQVAGTVFGGLLMYLVPSRVPREARAALVIAGAAMGAAVGTLV